MICLTIKCLLVIGKFRHWVAVFIRFSHFITGYPCVDGYIKRDIRSMIRKGKNPHINDGVSTLDITKVDKSRPLGFESLRTTCGHCEFLLGLSMMDVMLYLSSTSSSTKWQSQNASCRVDMLW